MSDPIYEADCVSGSPAECGAESGPYPYPEPVEEWMRRHARATGHRRYLRIYSDYVVLRPATETPEPPAACPHPGTVRHHGKTCCTRCRQQLYL